MSGGRRPQVLGELAEADVVVVDDNPANVALLQEILRAAGLARVQGFTEPGLALARCTRCMPDLVLLDLHMPDMDGFAFMRSLEQLVPTWGFLPVLVLTADATREVKERSLAAGAKDFLTKPFDRTEVLLRVGNLLETGTLYRELQRHNAELQTSLEERLAVERQLAVDREHREKRIERALAKGGFTVVFQPIADLATGAVVGAEALARFTVPPQRPPSEWFSEADVVGLGTELELAAVAAALDQIDQLPATAFLAINASPTTAASPDLDELLDRHPSERLVIELTEHTPIDDYDALIRALDRLRERGVRVAVDDTGAGYAGFQHLLRLRPHILKLDTTLTRGIDADPVRRALAASLVTFAAEIGAKIIAEGIELTGELRTLQSLGIPWGQGYHLARPGPLPLAALRLASFVT